MEHDAQLADGEDEEARRYEVEMGALLEGRDCIRALASRPADYIEDRIEALVRERDEARAALVALREAAIEVMAAFPHPTDDPAATARGVAAESAWGRTLAATPADLAARYRAEVRRAALVEAEEVAWKIHVQCLEAGRHGKANYRAQACEIVALRLRALADEGEKT